MKTIKRIALFAVTLSCQISFAYSTAYNFTASSQGLVSVEEGTKRVQNALMNYFKLNDCVPELNSNEWEITDMDSATTGLSANPTRNWHLRFEGTARFNGSSCKSEIAGKAYFCDMVYFTNSVQEPLQLKVNSCHVAE